MSHLFYNQQSGATIRLFATTRWASPRYKLWLLGRELVGMLRIIQYGVLGY
jgi:hypothetical protein